MMTKYGPHKIDGPDPMIPESSVNMDLRISDSDTRRIKSRINAKKIFVLIQKKN